MKLYLVPHAEALAKEENPDRPLSDKGRAEAGRMAAFLSSASISAAHVVHSGKARARETAVILAAPLGVDVSEAGFDLSPNGSTDGLAEAASGSTKDLMVVGHLPFMARAVSRLVGGGEEAAVVSFEPGSVACLEREDAGWTLAWMVRPELLGE